MYPDSLKDCKWPNYIMPRLPLTVYPIYTQKVLICQHRPLWSVGQGGVYCTTSLFIAVFGRQSSFACRCTTPKYNYGIYDKTFRPVDRLPGNNIRAHEGTRKKAAPLVGATPLILTRSCCCWRTRWPLPQRMKDLPNMWPLVTWLAHQQGPLSIAEEADGSRSRWVLNLCMVRNVTGGELSHPQPW